MTEKQKIFVRYTGKGAYIPGVPSVDMTEAEWKEIPPALQTHALEAGTHELIKKGTVNDGSALS